MLRKHSGILGYLILPLMVVILAYGVLMPIVVDTIISRYGYLDHALEAFIEENLPDASISFSDVSTGKFVFDASFRVIFSNLVLEKGGIAVNIKDAALTLPFTQLFTRHFTPSSVEFSGVLIDIKSKEAGKLPALDALLGWIVVVQNNISALPEFKIKDIAVKNQEKFFYYKNPILITHNLAGGSLFFVFDGGNSGNIKVTSSRVRNIASMVVEAENLKFHSSSMNFIASGSYFLDINTLDNSIKNGALNLNKLDGIFDINGKDLLISNLVADAKITDQSLIISNISMLLDGSRLHGSGNIRINNLFSAINYISFALDGRIPAHVMAYFLGLDITNSEGFLEKIYFVKSKAGLILNATMHQVGFLWGGRNFKDVNGFIAHQKDLLDLKIQSGYVDSGIRISDLVAKIGLKSEQVSASGKLAVDKKYLLNKLGNLEPHNHLERELKGLASSVLLNPSIAIDFNYIGGWGFSLDDIVKGAKLTIADFPIKKIKIFGINLQDFVLGGAFADGTLKAILKTSNEEEVALTIDGTERFYVKTSADFLRPFIAPLKSLEPYLTIEGNVELEVAKSFDGYKVNANLEHASINAAVLKIEKSVDSPARLSFILDDKNNIASALSFKTSDLELAIGMITARTDLIELDGVLINNSGPLHISLNLGGDIKLLKVEGESIRYSDWKIQSLIGEGNNHPLSFDIRASRLLMENNISLMNFRAAGLVSEKSIIEVGGVFEDGKETFYANYRQDKLKLGAGNAGALLAGLDITTAVRGGVLRIDSKNENGVFKGDADISGARLLRTSVVVKLLSLASMGGLIGMLDGSGIPFDRVNVVYTLQGDCLTIEESSYADGESLGIQLKGNIKGHEANLTGVLATAHIVDRAVQAIPLYGNILTGGSGGGIFGFSFLLKGDLKDPVITVNPLSFFAPGAMKRFFDKTGG